MHAPRYISIQDKKVRHTSSNRVRCNQVGKKRGREPLNLKICGFIKLDGARRLLVPAVMNALMKDAGC